MWGSGCRCGHLGCVFVFVAGCLGDVMKGRESVRRNQGKSGLKKWAGGDVGGDDESSRV